MFPFEPVAFYDFLFYILVVKLFIFLLQVVVAKEAIGNLGGMVRQLSLDQFENESRRMIPSNDLSYPTKKFTRQKSPQGLHKKVSQCSMIIQFVTFTIHTQRIVLKGADELNAIKSSIVQSLSIKLPALLNPPFVP